MPQKTLARPRKGPPGLWPALRFNPVPRGVASAPVQTAFALVDMRGGGPLTTVSGTGTLTINCTGAWQPQATDTILIVHGNDFYQLSNMPTPTCNGSTTGVNAITPVADGGNSFAHCKGYWFQPGAAGDVTVSVTETGLGDEEKCLVVYVLMNAMIGTPIDASNSNTDNTGSTLNHVALGVTPTSAKPYLIVHKNDGNGADAGATTPPTGMTETYDASHISFMHYAGAVQQLSGPGATGNKTFVCTANASYGTLTIAIAPQPGSSNKTVALDQVTETNIAGAITPTRRYVLGQVTETDTAQNFTRVKQQVVGRVTETDIARGLGDVKLLGQVTETDTARAITPAHSRVLGQVTETDTAQGFTRRKTVTLGQVTETDTAQALTRVKRRTIGQCTETDTAQALTTKKQLLLGQVTETDLARSIAHGALSATLGQVTETNTAQALTRVKRSTIGQVTETDTAQAFGRSKRKVIGQCTELDIAGAMNHGNVRPLDQVTETDIAQPFTRRKTLALGRCTETDTAQPIIHKKARTVVAPTETDTARPITPKQNRLVGRVTETDTAMPITPKGAPEVGLVQKHVAYLQQKTVGGNANYVKRRPGTVTALAADTNPRIRVRRTGEAYGNASVGVPPRSAPDANEVSVYVRY